MERYCSARAVGLIAGERLGKAVSGGGVAGDQQPAGHSFTWDMSKARSSSLLPLFKANGKVECKDVFDHMAKGDQFAHQLLDEVIERIAVLCKSHMH